MPSGNENKGVVFDIQRWSLHDGPGIRTNVFLKGCPLKCEWCSNPESQAFHPELVYFKDKCIGCKICERDCVYHAVSFVEEACCIDRSICGDICYAEIVNPYPCTKHCYAGALDRMGRMLSAEETLEDVFRDMDIYSNSGGGVTFTGGEPFAQPVFLKRLLENSKKERLHTVVETCAHVPWPNIESLLNLIDFIFVDIKHIDSATHARWTGKNNGQILENCRKLADACVNLNITLVVRTPVVPDVNDNPMDIGRIASFVRAAMPNVLVYQLLAFHRLGRGKYGNLARTCNLNDLSPPSDSLMEELNEVVRNYGFVTYYE
jgi:pyruvate formate lyase activating enzyme